MGIDELCIKCADKVHSKRAVQLDCFNIQDSSDTHPYPIGYQQQSRFFRDAPKAHDEKQNGKPQKNHFKNGKVGALQFEVDGAPQNIQKSVNSKQQNNSFLFIGPLSGQPSQCPTDSTQRKDGGPDHPKVGVWRLPFRVFERKIPGPQLCEAAPNTCCEVAQCKCNCKGFECC